MSPVLVSNVNRRFPPSSDALFDAYRPESLPPSTPFRTAADETGGHGERADHLARGRREDVLRPAVATEDRLNMRLTYSSTIGKEPSVEATKTALAVLGAAVGVAHAQTHPPRPPCQLNVRRDRPITARQDAPVEEQVVEAHTGGRHPSAPPML